MSIDIELHPGDEVMFVGLVWTVTSPVPPPGAEHTRLRIERKGITAMAYRKDLTLVKPLMPPCPPVGEVVWHKINKEYLLHTTSHYWVDSCGCQLPWSAIAEHAVKVSPACYCGGEGPCWKHR